MKHLLPITTLILLSMLISCQTASDSVSKLTGQSVSSRRIRADFTGYAGHYSSEEKEKEAAVEDAVRQILMEQKLIVNLYHYQRQSNMNTVSFGKMDYIWSEKKAEKVKSSLTVKDYETDSNGTKAFVSYDKNPAFSAIPSPEVWTVKPIEIPGYITFTGMSEALSTVSKSMREADDDALTQIVNYISASVSEEVDIYDSKHFSYATAKTKEEAVITIQGFRVIDRYSKDGLFYSLAVLPK